MKILSIGNSFSQDAHRYIHDIAKGEGVNIKCVNLYIGGCSLQTHYVNMMGDVAEYAFEFNGEPTGMRISIKRALSLDNWDYITIQQSSPIGDEYETYTPYAEALAETPVVVIIVEVERRALAAVPGEHGIVVE